MRRFATNLLGHLGRPLLNSPLASLCHRYLDLYYLHKLWRMSRRQSPHWYENRVLLHRWTKHLNPEFVEKGIQSRMALTPGCEVLDIGCGDGFYPYMFYVSLASRIDGIDLEEQAVRHAKRYHAHPKIRYFLRDAVLDDFPEADYDAILLNGALAHFSEESLALLLPKIGRALRSGGVFAGYEEMETAEEKT
jgi:SAM-dependent methyltransferase